MKEPIIAVGITSGKEITFTMTGLYRQPGNDGLVSGSNRVTMSESGLSMEWNGRKYTTLTFDPTSFDGDSFQLEGVTIGVEFDWERKENQAFRGSLRFVVNDGLIIAINDVPTEEYLKSVISSEMKATSSLSLLRAHAVISRSWLFAQIFRDRESRPGVERGFRDEKEIVKWWDHDDHTLFDVCADDHCQRYQGISKIVDGKAVGAVEDTRGEVLKYDGALCDTRFSKCCGGVFERFESCWEQSPHPYLAPRRDGVNENDFLDLTEEIAAAKWIESEPTAFCNTADRRILSQVLNEYDIESTDFYRWTETYTQEEIQELLRTRSDINVGKVLSLTPLERGSSGRIVRLKITG
ncbi:MAG: SpoIID/LytB domain-containing protein, partial [Duncaniella sp.]|nr:SpoIID/LytB domain-containing protein [Duncaniella sp.]